MTPGTSCNSAAAVRRNIAKMQQPQAQQAHPSFVPDEANTTPLLPVTSSIPSELPEPQASLFREVLEELERKRVPYAVSGAFALRQHTGICRFTKDLDIFLTAENCPPALQYLEKHGFGCEVCDCVWLSKARKDSFFVDLITGMS